MESGHDQYDPTDDPHRTGDRRPRRGFRHLQPGAVVQPGAVDTETHQSEDLPTDLPYLPTYLPYLPLPCLTLPYPTLPTYLPTVVTRPTRPTRMNTSIFWMHLDISLSWIGISEGFQYISTSCRNETGFQRMNFPTRCHAKGGGSARVSK